MTEKPLVSIVCATYNHESYVAQAIESFLMQKTSFPVEIIIGEDCSTDKTRKICLAYQKKYLDKIKLLLPDKNIGAMRIHCLALLACTGKYIANCDGDDYWTDPSKLQKQVNYMEGHPECSLCFHAVEIVKGNKKTGKVIRAFDNFKVFTSKKMFGCGSDAPSSSLLFQKRFIENLPDWFNKAPVGDIPLRLILSQHGIVVYINEVMAVRRVGVPGSWSDRTHDYKSRRSWYPAMITMLDNFNQYSNFKYSNDVIKEQFQYEIKGLVFQDKIDVTSMRKLFSSNKYRDCIRNLSFKKRLKLYLIYFFPNIYKKIYSSRIGWAVKKFILYKKI